jgi:hypothetical protein
MRKIMMFGLVFTTTIMILAVMPVKESAPADSDENFEAYFRAKQFGDSFWGPYTRLTHTPSDTMFPMVASNDNDPGHVVVVFVDNLTGEYEWCFTESLDSGDTWSTPQIAFESGFEIYVAEMFSAAVEMDSVGTVHMSFTRAKQFNTDQPTGIYYSRYDGTDWLAPTPIQEDMTPGTLRLYITDITVGSYDNTIHIAYGSDYPGNDNGDTWYSKSTDDGLTWSTPFNINLDNGMDVGYRPSLSADANGNVFKANDGGWPGWIWFRKSQDNGNSWDNHMQIGSPPYEHRKPLVMCNDVGGVFIVYMREAPGDYSLMYKYSSDFGMTWTPSQEGGIMILGSEPGMGHRYLAELDGSGFIHIAFGSTRTGILEAYYMKIDTLGNIISGPEIITPDDGNPSYLTGLALDDDHIYVSTRDYAPSVLEATIDIDPDTLNLKSQGKWITCYIELPSGYNVRDIDATTILLEDLLGCELDPKYGFVTSEDSYIMDHDNDTVQERMVKFDRSAVQEILSPGTYNLKVTGKLTDGTEFIGYSDEITVIDPPKDW